MPVTMVQPVYPEFAQQAGIQGTVVLSVLVGEDGRVRDVKVIKSVPGLDQAAVDALKQWVFKPGTRDGNAVGARVTVPLVFKSVQASIRQ